MAEEYIVEVLPTDECVTKGELIRCKECKWYGCTNGFDGSKIVKIGVCNLYMDALSPWAESRYYPGKNDYCSRAERKEE